MLAFVMKNVRIKPNTKKRVYVVIQDPSTRKSRQITLYGVTTDQAIRLIREAVEQTQSSESDATQGAV